VAHNASFDAGFLGCELRRAGHVIPDHRVFDTLALARRRHPELRRHGLESLVAVFGLDHGRGHRALADALCVKDLWIRLEGPCAPPEMLVSYPIHDPEAGFPSPHGWDTLDRAIAHGLTVRITYQGGTRGSSPRAVSPRRFLQKGGEPYLIAYCHLARREEEFRLDRIRSCDPGL
jgi:DNA polymerase III epsilon subunit-like protein